MPGSATHLSPRENPLTFFPISEMTPTTSCPGINCSTRSACWITWAKQQPYRKFRDEFPFMNVSVSSAHTCVSKTSQRRTEKYSGRREDIAPHHNTALELRSTEIFAIIFILLTFEQHIVVSNFWYWHLFYFKFSGLYPWTINYSEWMRVSSFWDDSPHDNIRHSSLLCLSEQLGYDEEYCNLGGVRWPHKTHGKIRGYNLYHLFQHAKHFSCTWNRSGIMASWLRLSSEPVEPRICIFLKRPG